MSSKILDMYRPFYLNGETQLMNIQVNLSNEPNSRNFINYLLMTNEGSLLLGWEEVCHAEITAETLPKLAEEGFRKYSDIKQRATLAGYVEEKLHIPKPLETVTDVLRTVLNFAEETKNSRHDEYLSLCISETGFTANILIRDNSVSKLATIITPRTVNNIAYMREHGLYLMEKVKEAIVDHDLFQREIKNIQGSDAHVFGKPYYYRHSAISNKGILKHLSKESVIDLKKYPIDQDEEVFVKEVGDELKAHLFSGIDSYFSEFTNRQLVDWLKAKQFI